MKTIKFILILLISLSATAQMAHPPAPFWLTDADFEDKINERQAFGDDNHKPVLIEFWAEFNKDNCFADWDKVKDVIFYRVNIALAPNTKKKYRVRMPPTLIIFKDGLKTKTWKAGLDLLIPVDLKKVQEAIDEINKASKF